MLGILLKKRATTDKHLSYRGFTLIEVLIATSISVLLVGGGIAAYITFNDRQTIQTSGNKLESYLRTAQKRSRVGDRPSGCDRLDGYAVRMPADSGQISLIAVCGNGDQVTKLDSLSGNVVSSGSVDIEFGVLHGGVTGAAPITLTDGTASYQLNVTAGGEIEKVGFVGGQ